MSTSTATQTPKGNSPTGPSSAWYPYLLQWQQARCDEAVADIFGYYALQLGQPALDGLRCNRMAQRWLAHTPGDIPANSCAPAPQTTLHCYPEALPFAEASVDLLILPHTLEHCQEPHAALREVARVLVPEGRVLIFGLNPFSLWGMQHALERPQHAPLSAAQGLSYRRLRDWLALLALEVVATDFGCYAPALNSPEWLARWRWMDGLGQRLWPVLGAAYCVLAVKKVHGSMLLPAHAPGRAWPRQAAGVAAASSSYHPRQSTPHSSATESS